MNDTRRIVLALILLAVIVFCAITITNTLGRTLRVDLTADRLYTLSEGTRAVIADIEQPMELRLYYSRTAATTGPEGFRAYNTYYFYIRDLLREYESLSGGKLNLVTIDPRPYSEEELDAVSDDIRRFSTGDESFFFGLAVVSEFGRRAAVPFFDPHRQPLAEYEISSALYNAATVKKTRVGILSPLPLFGAELSPYMKEMMRMQGQEVPEEWHMVKHLRRFCDVEKIAPDTVEIDDGLDLLMVVHPRDLQKHHYFAIDQYVMGGGSMVVFVDPYCFGDPAEDHHEKASSLNRLLERWGVSLVPETVTADPSLAVSVHTRRDQPPQRLATFLDLRDDALNRDDVITAQLESVQMLFAGALETTGAPGVRFEPLLRTTGAGGRIVASPADVRAFSDPRAIARDFEEGAEPVVVGCRLTGTFSTAFPDGITVFDERDDSARYLEARQESPRDTTIVVFADVDMITDYIAFHETFFGATPQGDNMNLLLNTVETLGGAAALSTARVKGRFNRPFHVFDRIELEAEQATAAKVAAVEAEIDQYRQELRALGDRADGDAEAIIHGEALERKRDLEERILIAQRELRELNRDKRVRIESLTNRIRLINTVAAPSIVLLIAVVVFLARSARRRKYLGARHDQ